MIPRPTTEQIARDCARQLLDVVLPAVQGDSASVAVQMLENVLRNVAVRAAHEIAWMTEETAAMEAFARDVLEAVPGADAVGDALDRLAGAPRASLHLDDVVETYSRAGDALSAALEAAMAGGHADLAARAGDLLHVRCAREVEVMSDWSPIGR